MKPLPIYSASAVPPEFIENLKRAKAEIDLDFQVKPVYVVGHADNYGRILSIGRPPFLVDYWRFDRNSAGQDYVDALLWLYRNGSARGVTTVLDQLKSILGNGVTEMSREALHREGVTNGEFSKRMELDS